MNQAPWVIDAKVQRLQCQKNCHVCRWNQSDSTWRMQGHQYAPCVIPPSWPNPKLRYLTAHTFSLTWFWAPMWTVPSAHRWISAHQDQGPTIKVRWLQPHRTFTFKIWVTCPFSSSLKISSVMSVVGLRTWPASSQAPKPFELLQLISKNRIPWPTHHSPGHCSSTSTTRPLLANKAAK